MAAVSLVLTTFQLASTALTVTLKAVPAVWAAGVPVLPVVVPGAGVSPGANNCSFTKPAALTGMPGVVLGLLLPLEVSVAVTVGLPPVLSVTLKVPVPLASAVLAGSTAFASDEVMPTVSVTLVI